MNFTDLQVLALVRDNPDLNLYQLEKKAKEEMVRWPWTIGKIQKAVERLEKAGKIETESVVQGGRACVLVRCKRTV
jgi:DNA-binding PadR family transcriptional regulator